MRAEHNDLTALRKHLETQREEQLFHLFQVLRKGGLLLIHSIKLGAG